MVSSLLAGVYGRDLSSGEEERVRAAVPEVEWLADCVAMGPAWMQAPAHLRFFSELGRCLISARCAPAEAHVAHAKASGLRDGALRAAASLRAAGGDAAATAAAEADVGAYMAKIAEVVATRVREIGEAGGHRCGDRPAPEDPAVALAAGAAGAHVLESLVRSPQPPCAAAEVLVLEVEPAAEEPPRAAEACPQALPEHTIREWQGLPEEVLA